MRSELYEETYFRSLYDPAYSGGSTIKRTVEVAYAATGV